MQQDVEVDLALRIVVCQLCAAFPQEATGLPRTWLPFLLGRFGDRPLSSLHTEALVTEWLTQPERHDLDGDWRRMRTVGSRTPVGGVTGAGSLRRGCTPPGRGVRRAQGVRLPRWRQVARPSIATGRWRGPRRTGLAR
ncbi:hypothetical protein ABID95_002977 [Streptomyces atratus]